MTSPSTRNLKALGLWVFFLIYYLIFSFLVNVELRLILEFLGLLYIYSFGHRYSGIEFKHNLIIFQLFGITS